MAHFQVPDDRTFDTAASPLQPWPQNADGYRLFVKGNGPDERIGIHLGQAIELQLTGGRGLRIETIESQSARRTAAVSGVDQSVLEARLGGPVWLSTTTATSDKQKFTVSTGGTGRTFILATDSAEATKAKLEVVVGNFESDPRMIFDLIADVGKGSDSFKIHALQRMLNNRWLASGSFTNGDNVFEQNASSNTHDDPDVGNMTCGHVAKWRGSEVFDKIASVDHDWYLTGFHEPVGKVSKRDDLKYRPERIQAVKTQIVSALSKKTAVRVGVADDPKIMVNVGGKLVAYWKGGHTALIVGCTTDLTQFLYIDPWGGGSKMEYKGGIAGNKVPGACEHLGLFALTHDPARRARSTPPANKASNLMRQSLHTEGSFSEAKGNYLEVISAPFVL